MSKDKSTRKNRKPQIIDLTSETFEFSDQGFAIEGFIAHDGKQWFSAEIACSPNNLNIVNVSSAVSSLPYKDKAIIVIRDSVVPVQHLMVSEAGLYRLIFKSRTEAAEAYQNWIFDDVLPAIRKHGGYISPTATPEQIAGLESQIATLKGQLADSYRVNRWLGGQRRAGQFIESTLPPRDRD